MAYVMEDVPAGSTLEDLEIQVLDASGTQPAHPPCSQSEVFVSEWPGRYVRLQRQYCVPLGSQSLAFPTHKIANELIFYRL